MLETIRADDPKALCPECKTLRVNGDSGAFCPNGHGRIIPVKIKPLKPGPKWPQERIAVCPKAREVLVVPSWLETGTRLNQRLFQIEGQPGLWEKLSGPTYRAGEPMPEGDIHARDEATYIHYPNVFRRARDVEEKLRRLLG